MQFAGHTGYSSGLGCPSYKDSSPRRHLQHHLVHYECFLWLLHLHEQITEQFPGRPDRAGRHGMLFSGVFMVRSHSQQSQRIVGSKFRKRQPSPSFLALDRHLFRPVRVSFVH